MCFRGLAFALQSCQFDLGLLDPGDDLPGQPFGPDYLRLGFNHAVLQGDQELFSGPYFALHAGYFTAQVGDNLLPGCEHVAVQQHHQQDDGAKAAAHDVEERQVEL